MKQFSLKLRIILLSNYLYYILLFISILYVILYCFFYKEEQTVDNYSILTISDYEIDGSKLSITFKEHLVGTYYFQDKLEKEKFNLKINDKVKIYGTVKEPSNNTIPNMFNYKKYLYHKKIKYILSIEKIFLFKQNKNIFFKIKNIVIDRIKSINHNEYLYAFILGKSSYIDRSIYNNYKINGITHLFALSGLHVSLFSSIILFILKKIKINEKISYILTGFFLIFFSFIASFTPSILRATIFFILSSINNIYYFYIKPKNLLFLTFTIMILINPFYVFNTGFILSFTITYFILLFNENYNVKNNILSILVISILSFFSSLPIIINMSYEINIIGFINNLFFIPFVSYIVFPLSLLTIIIPKLSIILNSFIKIMEYVSLLSSNFFNINIIIPKISFVEIFLYYLIFIILIKFKKKVFVMLFFLLLIFFYLKSILKHKEEIIFLDVSQGDSTLILKDNYYIMIDTGGKIQRGKDDWEKTNDVYNTMISEIIPFMKSIGIKKLNYLILSHGDYDHMGEAINLVNNFKVEKVIFNCGEYNDLEKELIKVLDKKKIKYYPCIRELNIDKNKLYFLQTKEYDNENDNSNVIYTELNGYKFIFMGDAGVEKEKDIIGKYNLYNIDVLKVGHHGSKTSSSKYFIDNINPKYSIISVGKNNRYGHPNKEVLTNLEQSKIYRTDQDGSIMFKIKNSKLKIETCSP